MLTYVGNEGRVLAYLFTDGLYDEFGLEVLAVVLDIGDYRLPFCDLLEPIASFRIIYKRSDLFKRGFYVADNRKVDVNVFLDLTLVDIDVDYLCFRSKVIGLESNTVRKSCSDSDYKVCAVNSFV